MLAYRLLMQGWAKCRAPSLVNLVPTVAYHFCLALPAAFTQPWARLLAEPCREGRPPPLTHSNKRKGDRVGPLALFLSWQPFKLQPYFTPQQSISHFPLAPTSQRVSYSRLLSDLRLKLASVCSNAHELIQLKMYQRPTIKR